MLSLMNNQKTKAMTDIPMDKLECTILENNCGEVEFHPIKKTAQYVRIPHDTDEEELFKLLTKKWKLEAPQIVISVTGGAKDFKMRSRLTKEFQKSLVKMAESTGAWIVTGGTHCGVMKHVGDAIHKHSTSKSKKIVTLGIVTWGIVSNRDKLKIVENQTDKAPPVTYYSNDSQALNMHHSHFILVDDGSENKFGREIELRTKLERFIAGQEQKTKVVCVIVQGGPGSLKTVFNALSCGTPVVVIGGSGGWANILASLYDESIHAVSEEKIVELLKENGLSCSNRSELSDWTNMARDCVKTKKLMTVFSLDEADRIDLDVSILRSILKAQLSDDDTKETHLKLALAWNRADIAKDEILSDNLKIENDALAQTFIDAIEQDKPNFIKVLYDHGLSLRNFFTKEDLIGLYKKARLRGKLKVDDEIDLHKVKKYLLGSLFQPHRDTGTYTSVIEIFKNKGSQAVLRELFFFCIVSKKYECAHMLWEEMTEESLPAAIVASRVFKVLSKLTRSGDEREDLLAHSDGYKDLAYGILTECFDNDKHKTMTLLKRRLEPWGNLTSLQIAVDSGDIELVSHPAVQYFLDQIWYGEIKKTKQAFWHVLWQSFSIYICAFVFLLIPLLINFKKGRREKISDSESGTTNKSTAESSTTDEIESQSFFGKVHCYYNAPIVKFHLAIIFHIIFLFLFAYILLFNFFDTINGFEIALVVWIGFLVLEEIRQLLVSPGDGFWMKTIHWWEQLGNKLDLLSFVLYFIGFGLRFTTFLDASRVLLCFSFVVFCLRILSMFTVNKQLGPKLLMVQQMLKDLFFFLFILFVFLISYGVASQSLLYPNEPDVGLVFAGILSKPYWNIFGELFLPEIDYNPTTDEFSCTNNRSLIDQGFRRCPDQNKIVPIISSLYLLLANVLLLNLLIAMFSYTFDKLIDKTDKIWKYQRFSLIEEYYKRPPVLPVSLSCLPIFTSCCSKSVNNAFEMTLNNNELRDLLVWEHQNKDHYMDSELEKKKESVESKVQSISERLDALTNTISDVQTNLTNQRRTNRRMKALEDQLKTSNESLSWIMTALMQQNFVPKFDSGQVHTKARSSPYPESSVQRFPLEDHLVPWNVPLSVYNPPNYTSPTVLPSNDCERPIWADDESQVSTLPYNRFDEDSHVDRSSHLGRYRVINGLPQNPLGRTGICGRGLLGRFGPNHAADPIVTRWRRNEHGEKILVDGKGILQFVAIQREDTGDWAIPGGMCDPGENVSKTLQREFEEEVSLVENMSQEEKDQLSSKLGNFFRSRGREVFRGYCDDHRNTDNAWIETCAYNFHDHDDSVFKSLPLAAGDGARRAQWVDVTSSLTLFADHKKYIEKVAVMLNASFSSENLSQTHF